MPNQRMNCACCGLSFVAYRMRHIGTPFRCEYCRMSCRSGGGANPYIHSPRPAEMKP